MAKMQPRRTCQLRFASCVLRRIQKTEENIFICGSGPGSAEAGQIRVNGAKWVRVGSCCGFEFMWACMEVGFKVSGLEDGGAGLRKRARMRVAERVRLDSGCGAGPPGLGSDPPPLFLFLFLIADLLRRCIRDQALEPLLESSSTSSPSIDFFQKTHQP